MNEQGQPVLYLVVCGAPPAQGSPGVAEFVVACQGTGWDVCVVPTRLGRRFLDTGHLAKLTGHPLRDDYRFPHEEDVLPTPADAIFRAPATFNTVNKLGAGISDTLWLGLLNEAIGGGVPVTMAIYTNEALAAHPLFGRNVEALRSFGVRFVPDTDDLALLSCKPAGVPFPWDQLEQVARGLYLELTGQG
jgi:phosphopantothenoylcysteine synthetase/decarboxylase